MRLLALIITTLTMIPVTLACFAGSELFPPLIVILFPANVYGVVFTMIRWVTYMTTFPPKEIR